MRPIYTHIKIPRFVLNKAYKRAAQQTSDLMKGKVFIQTLAYNGYVLVLGEITPAICKKYIRMFNIPNKGELS